MPTCLLFSPQPPTPVFASVYKGNVELNYLDITALTFYVSLGKMSFLFAEMHPCLQKTLKSLDVGPVFWFRHRFYIVPFEYVI